MARPILNQQTFNKLGRYLLTMLVATGVVGGGIRMAEFTSVGSVDPNSDNATVASDWLYAFVTQTGSDTLKYPATCIESPLEDLGLGSGGFLSIGYEVDDNPAEISADVVLTTDCTDHNSSGTLIPNHDNVGSASGSHAFYGSGFLVWNPDYKIKVILKGDPTSSYSARVKVNYRDIYGK